MLFYPICDVMKVGLTWSLNALMPSCVCCKLSRFFCRADSASSLYRSRSRVIIRWSDSCVNKRMLCH